MKVKLTLIFIAALCGCDKSPNDFVGKDFNQTTIREYCDNMEYASPAYRYSGNVSCVAIYLKDIRDHLVKNKGAKQ